jgi:hypothetical protein
MLLRVCVCGPIREGAMANVCRECQAPVSWNVRECPNCGDPHPLGRNPPGAMLMLILKIAAGILFCWLILRMLLMTGLTLGH